MLGVTCRNNLHEQYEREGPPVEARLEAIGTITMTTTMMMTMTISDTITDKDAVHGDVGEGEGEERLEPRPKQGSRLRHEEEVHLRKARGVPGRIPMTMMTIKVSGDLPLCI